MRISKRDFQENKVHPIFRKTNISYPMIRTRCAYQEIRNVRFSENCACFVFLKEPFWDSPFCLITDEYIMEKVFISTVATFNNNWRNKKIYLLTHFSPIHPFSAPWKHQKTVRFCDVFRGYRKGALWTN